MVPFMAERWIALHCGEDSEALLMNRPAAFLLLTQIAMRAKWKPCSITKLNAGQAFIGDWREAGLSSEKVYRNAKAFLAECGLATFEGRTKGTVATLTDKRIFSFEREDKGEQWADRGRTEGGQRATNHTDTQIHGDKEEKKSAKPAKKTKSPEPELFPLELPFPSKEFAEAWESWTKHRMEKKKPLTKTSTKLQLKELLGWGEARAVAALIHSTKKGYEGIYEPRSDTQPNGYGQSTPAPKVNIGSRKPPPKWIPPAKPTPDASLFDSKPEPTTP